MPFCKMMAILKHIKCICDSEPIRRCICDSEPKNCSYVATGQPPPLGSKPSLYLDVLIKPDVPHLYPRMTPF